MRQDCDILSHQFCGQQGGGTSTHIHCLSLTERERDSVCVERERETGKTKKLSITNNHERKLGLQRHCCSMDLGYFSFLHK